MWTSTCGTTTCVQSIAEKIATSMARIASIALLTQGQKEAAPRNASATLGTSTKTRTVAWTASYSHNQTNRNKSFAKHNNTLMLIRMLALVAPETQHHREDRYSNTSAVRA